MPTVLSIKDARDKLTQLPEQLQEHGYPEAATVTRRGRPVLAILPYELYETLLETLEVMGDRTLLEALQQSITDLEAGNTVSLADAEARLGL